MCSGNGETEFPGSGREGEGGFLVLLEAVRGGGKEHRSEKLTFGN